jgi:hypothetical protein
MSIWPAVFTIAIVALGVAGTVQFFQLGATARKQFAAARIVSEDPRFSFDGSVATVVFERRQYVEGADAPNRYSLFRISKNAYGEYFLFISGEKPYLEHLTKERAMNAMRYDKRAYAKEFGDSNAA